jgi:hypothetical protein
VRLTQRRDDRAVGTGDHADVRGVDPADPFLCQHLGRGARRLDPSLMQQHQVPRVLPRCREVVQGGQHGQAGGRAEFVDQVENLLLVADVQGRGRLVEQQDPGLLGERASQHDALAFAAGQTGQPAAGEPVDPEPLGGPGGRRPVGPARAAQVAKVRGAAEQHVIRHRHVGRQHRFLRHVGDQPGPVASAQRSGAGPVETHLAAMRHQPGDGAEQGCLARAVRPDQGEPAAGPDRTGHPVQHRRPVQVHRQVSYRDRAHVRTDRVLRKIQTNAGEPTSAVTTPIGSSAGDRTVLASVSASTRNPAPVSSDSGSTSR